MSIVDGFLSLASKINKVGKKDQDETTTGPSQDKLPELELDMGDEDLLALTQKWERSWNDSDVKSEWEKMCDENERYWKGKQYSTPQGDQRPLVDNAIFESLETFLPQATKRNPEPIITVAGRQPDPQYVEFAQAIQQMAADWADEIKLRLKIKRVARYWSIYILGAAEVGWSISGDRPSVVPVRPKKLILDPEGYIDEDGYHGRFAGVIQKDEAALLIKRFPKKEKDITDAVGAANLGTNVKYIKWLTPEYTCFTLNKIVLDKMKNPHWNYEQTTQPDPQIDDYGQEVPQAPVTTPGNNHFSEPAIPIVFLTVFNLGDQPTDNTSLITQNLPLQDWINKLNKQIDKNVDKMNGGQVISGDRTGLTQEQATVATQALDNGGTIYIPQGDAQTAIAKIQGQQLPADVFNKLLDNRNRLKDVFGTRGSTPSGISSEDTVRGKIITHGLDTDRIGGGITEYLEQFADDVFNWYLQLLYVYQPQLFQQFQGKLVASVKEGSLLPKDNVTQANQAMELAVAGKMSLIDLYKRLEDPDPEKTAANAWLEINAPEVLYDDPRIQQAIQMKQQAAMQQQQQQQQQDQMKAQADQKNQANGKMMDHQSKMQQIQAQKDGTLLNRVPTQ